MKNKLNADQINLILNESLDTNIWLYILGESISGEDLSIDKRLSFDFFNAGKRYWDSIKGKLQEVMCDNANKKPKQIIYDALDENKLALIDQLYAILTGELHLEISAAIPVISLLLKNGFENFCAN